MKKIIATAATVLALGPMAAAAQQTLIFGEAAPNRGARSETLTWVINEITDKTGMPVQEQWAGALFNAAGALDGIGSRVADFGTVIAAYNPTELTGYNIADLPLGYTDPWVLMQATDDLMRSTPEIQQQMADLGLVYVGGSTTTALDLGCKDKTITTLADFDGVSVRVAGTYGRALSDVYGVIPVRDSIYNAYQGLDTGLYDCSMGYAYVTNALRWYEQFTSYTKLGWGQFGGVGLVMNLDTWESLSPEDQAAITEIGKQMTNHFGEAIQAETQAAFAQMEENGIEILEITDAEREQLLASSEPYIAEWVERANKSGLDGEALLVTFRGLLDKYEQERIEQGYPWER
ncbi:MAG: C4-dicarboxylate TRAP transporter substrate-binding protein [Marinibacterium sp.]|nr:C4-dicarboxylate TRAP transporter substrate-binding protein [Marinibacterium sp.]